MGIGCKASASCNLWRKQGKNHNRKREGYDQNDNPKDINSKGKRRLTLVAYHIHALHTELMKKGASSHDLHGIECNV
jgi:hypothetical protein